MAISDLFSKRRKDEQTDADVAVVYPTRALAKFLSGLAHAEQPLLLDLGPVVGANVSFFGEELGCKILVENLYAYVDRRAAAGTLTELAGSLDARLTQADGSVDGILCWDLFDYLDRAGAQALAKRLVRMLKPDGVLLGYFANSAPAPNQAAHFTKYVVVDRGQLEYRSYPTACGRQQPLPNRDIQRNFEPLRITEQFLMKNNVREILFRKPAAAPDQTPSS